MGRNIILWLILTSILLLCCSKEDEELITGFRGIVINELTGQPLKEGFLIVMGRPVQFTETEISHKYRERFPVEPDGTFDVSIQTSSVTFFDLALQVNDKGIFYKCEEVGPINGYCTLFEPGREYSGIKISGDPERIDDE